MISRTKLAVACLAVCVGLGLGGCAEPVTSNVEGAGIVGAPKNTFYVSKSGSGADGRSWTTAWNELSAISWGSVQPGDLVIIDGGEASMVYETSLTVTKSGKEGSPIQIRTSTEAGRSGQVVINGGRGQSLPYCQQFGYPRPPGVAKPVGIDLSKASWIYFDGGRWAGVRAHSFDGPGLKLSDESSHITVRGLELDDNGVPAWKDDDRWYPSGEGLAVAGDHMLLEQLIVHDNGGDALSVKGSFSALVMRNAWLYNRRAHPSDATEPFNFCARTSGLRVSEGGEQTGLIIESSLVGPGFSTGLLLGDATSETRFGVVHNLELRNTLLVGHHGTSAVSNLSALLPARHPPQGWKIENVTSVRDAGSAFTNIAALGEGHVVSNSIFAGAAQTLLERPTVDQNCQWGTVSSVKLGVEGDPLFVDVEFAGVGVGFADFDFALQPASACAGLGASITSVQSLLGVADPSAPIQANASASTANATGNTGASTGTGTGTSTGGSASTGVTAPNVVPTISFVVPINNAVYAAGATFTLVTSPADSDGTIASVEFFDGTTSLGTATAAPFSMSVTPANGTHVYRAVATDNKGGTAEVTRSVIVGN